MKSRKRKLLKLCIMCLMPLLALLITISNSYAYYLNSDGNIESNNVAIEYTNNGWSCSIKFDAQSNTTYSLKASGTSSINEQVYIQYNGSIIQQVYAPNSYSSSIVDGFHFTTSNNVSGNVELICRFNVYVSTLNNVMLNVGNEYLSYEPYGVWISQENVNYTNSLLANMGLLQYLSYMQVYNNVTNQDIEIDGVNEFTKDYLIDNQLISSSGVLNLNYFNTSELNPNYNPYKITFYFDSNIPLNLFNLAFQNYSSGTMTLIGNGTYIIQINSSVLSYDSNLINDTSLTYIDELVITFDSADALSNINFNSYSIVNYNNGYNYGYNVGDNVGYQRGYNEGDSVGYQRGYNEGIEQDFENTGFKTLITTILSYPVNMVKESLNFEFMGVHVASIVLFIVSLGIVAFVIKRFKD